MLNTCYDVCLCLLVVHYFDVFEADAAKETHARNLVFFVHTMEVHSSMCKSLAAAAMAILAFTIVWTVAFPMATHKCHNYVVSTN